MLRQLMVGGGVSVLNIAIHALVMTIVVRVAQIRGADYLAPIPALDGRHDSDGVGFDDYTCA